MGYETVISCSILQKVFFVRKGFFFQIIVFRYFGIGIFPIIPLGAEIDSKTLTFFPLVKVESQAVLSLVSGGSIFTVLWCYSRLATEVTSPLNLKRSVARFAANTGSLIESTVSIAFKIWNAKISWLPYQVAIVL